LSYDAIRSPITGRAGVINVFPGSLVQPGNTVSTTTSATATSTQGAMVTVAQLNPMNVQFTVPESAVSTLLASQQAGEALIINFQTSDGKKREGKVYVIDNQVDAAIGAVKVKAQVDNKDDSLLPGQFVHLQLKAGTLKDVLVVPSQAVVTNQRGEQVYVVDAESVVQLKPIKVVLQGQGMSVIAGVNEGDRIVVEGKQNLRPNGKVKEAEKPAAKDSAKAASGAASAASASSPAASAASAAGSQP
jgi:RND family efflux transporter MFP subunit